MTDTTGTTITFGRAVRAALARVPAGCPAGGPGWCAAAAGILEASAPKPGNVHPGAAFADLCHADLVNAALAVAPVFEGAAGRPVGRTVLRAVEASRGVTRSNANLGIVLAIAPLAATPEPTAAAAETALAALGPDDAADVWRGIRLARPGGLGASARHDVHGPPPADLRDAMREAAPRDAIARLWAEGYAPLFAGAVADLDAERTRGTPAGDCVVLAFLRQLARAPDSLVARRHGAEAAAAVSARAAAVLAAGTAWREPAAAFDRFLRAPRRLNPGTTADLVAAALYILLRDPARRAAWIPDPERL